MTTKVALLYGGDSPERSVSISSADGVEAALSARGHWVYPLDLRTLGDLGELDRVDVDVAFLAMHGGFGEDGRLQRRLKKRGLPYTGSGPGASKRAMNKFRSKKRFVENNIPTPAFALVTTRTSPRALARKHERLGFPLVLKPVRGGSSIDVVVARTPDDLWTPIQRLLRKYGRVLLERFVGGREFTVAVLEGHALPLVEIRPNREFYDFHAKYLSTATRYVTAPLLPRYLRRAIEDMGLGAHRALGCRDFSRVDVMLDEHDQPFVLEVNTLPGLTPTSLLPKAAHAAGLSYADLCATMLELADRKLRLAG